MKYKLLKDLPSCRAGTIRKLDGADCLNFDGAIYGKEFLDRHPDWFEPVIERWIGVAGEKYYFVYAAGDVGCADCGEHRTYFNHGNYFRTKEQAEEASKRIKQTLMDYHKDLNS